LGLDERRFVEIVLGHFEPAIVLVCLAGAVGRSVLLLALDAGAYTRPLLSSTYALEGLITQETRRLTIDLSRANTLQGLTLVHFSAQRKHLVWAARLHFSVCREHFLWARLCV